MYNTQNFLPNPTMKIERKDTINVKIYRTAIDLIEKYKNFFAYFFVLYTFLIYWTDYNLSKIYFISI